MGASVRLHLVVEPGPTWHKGSALWERRVDLDFLPNASDENDYIHLMRKADDGETWLPEHPKRRWWDYDGSVTLEFVGYMIDPDEETANNHAMRGGRMVRPWWTSIDGDLNAHLVESGWRPL